MSSALLQLQDKLQLASSEYQKLQNDLTAIIDARQRLGAQQQENELVKKEFQQLTPNNTVYKLIGPVLVQQDQAEAKSNVDKRLEFIQSEVKRVEKQIEDGNAKLEKKKLEIVEIQTEIQQKSQANPAATAPAAISA
ncbi:hypothetical protein QCA50_008784 [Cerrena zonata]|uniref:Prefoldin subunit 6 n=1 Tax=Cerrena zonata TaxID=2478898 RepID=A0AAW0GFZ1_9APHY